MKTVTNTMPYEPITQQASVRVFTFFSSIYFILYCFIPYFYSVTLWPDSAQMFTWSQHFAWGYHEHPWVPPFIINLFVQFTHHSELTIFFIGGCLNLLAFWGVWQLGRKFLPEECALIAALLLSCYLLTSFFLGQVNNNTFNFGLWPIMYLFFYNGIVTQKTSQWIAAGIIAALATLSKYYTLFPLACLGFFILCNKQARLSFTKQGIYWGVLSYLLFLLPHIVWLFNNDFISLRYAMARTESHSNIFFQIYNPILFALSQFANFAIPFILLIFISFTCPRYNKSEWSISRFNKEFIFIMAWGPLILTMILSAIFGWNLPNEWGQALPCLWSLALISVLLPKFSNSKFNNQIKIIFLSMIILMFSSMLFLKIQSRYKPYIALNFPAHAVAKWMNEEWLTRYQTPLKYIVSSDEYVGGVVAFYSPDHPDVYSHCKDCINPVKQADLEKHGAMFILTDGYGGHFHLHKVVAKMQSAFPRLIAFPTRYFKTKRSPSTSQLPKTIVWTGILPPSEKIG